MRVRRSDWAIVVEELHGRSAGVGSWSGGAVDLESDEGTGTSTNGDVGMGSACRVETETGC
jgi:hypothetical protein